MTPIFDETDLIPGDDAREFEGARLGACMSIILVDSRPGSGPKLHWHPYEEVFVVHEGDVTFTLGDEVIEARGGQIVVAPAGVPHKFVNSGSGQLRQTDIHASNRFITEWLEV
ncbi:MAG TPA: cupin domain-containing protein [Thermomicrobiales bacterium]|nr:cupin domain-containing protein [Thermomicrobiales bacterium]